MAASYAADFRRGMRRAVRLLLERHAVAGTQLAERREPDLAVLCRQVPATWPSTRNVVYEGGILTWNTSGRYASGSTCVRRAWTRSIASQVGRNRTGAGVSGSGSGPSSTSSSSVPSSARNVGAPCARRRPSPARPSSPSTTRRRRPCRPEGRQVAPTSCGSASASATASPGPMTSSARRAQVGPAPLPGARRRHAQDPRSVSIEKRTAGCRRAAARPSRALHRAAGQLGSHARQRRRRLQFAGALVARPAHSRCVRATAPRKRR